ncbi:MAG: DUF2400 domain-containing protein [Bacteroidales bacterium]|nr:DUF2400 domain-containing protein [Bacteroidales bacterium]
MDERTKELLLSWAEEYNDPKYFSEDPINFPQRLAGEYKAGKRLLADVEIAAVFAAHLSWGRRCMIVRDCGRLFDEMDWRPYDYVMRGKYRDEPSSLHRTVKWSEIAAICSRLRGVYGTRESIEGMDQAAIRTGIFGAKPDPKAPNKKINMMRRWMVRRDGRVDLGLWKNTSPAELIIPLDVHVYGQSVSLGLTSRSSKDIVTAMEITDAFRELFPDDPCKGDFALFGYGVTHSGRGEEKCE